MHRWSLVDIVMSFKETYKKILSDLYTFVNLRTKHTIEQSSVGIVGSVSWFVTRQLPQHHCVLDYFNRIRSGLGKTVSLLLVLKYLESLK